MILIIILGVICCDLAFCQLDKSVLIIHYGDVNYYAENENYWAETNGRNVEFTDKKSENKKIIKTGFCSKPDCTWYEPCVYIKMWR